MRAVNTVGWVLVGTLVAWFGWQRTTTPAYAQHDAAFAQRAFGESGGLIAIQLVGDQVSDRVVVVDPRQRSMVVYDVGREDGKIRIKSMRPLRWDLQMAGYNCESPTPEEVRLGLERE